MTMRFKPFSPRELVARIRAVLRRGGPAAENEMLHANELSLDLASHRVSVGEALLDMGPTEYRLLEFFMSHPERVYSRGQLLDRVWGQQRLCRGAYCGCAYPPPAQGAGAAWP